MKYNNTVIKVKNSEHGANVIKWWQCQDVNTKNYAGSLDGRYYGIIDNNFVCYTLEQVQSANATIIELPNELPQRGDTILVWDNDEKDADRRIFLAYIEGAKQPITCVDKHNEYEFTYGKEFDTTKWKHWKPIPKEDIAEELVELTVEDISNGKGVGVKPDMNSYKLIKEYPGSPTIGTIAKEDKIDYVYYYLEKDSHTGIGSSIIENNPEFWEKVVEKNYEILEYRAYTNMSDKEVVIAKLENDGFYHFTSNLVIIEPHKIITNESYKIHSVKRLEDGSIFTIGDITTAGIIKMFTLSKDDRILISFENNAPCYLDCRGSKLTKLKPLFTTEDGVDIYEGDVYWFLRKDYEPFIPASNVAKGNNPNNPQIQKHLGFITFSTKEKAEEYIYLDKPRFSFKDIEKAIVNNGVISNKKSIINLIHASLEKYCL